TTREREESILTRLDVSRCCPINIALGIKEQAAEGNLSIWPRPHSFDRPEKTRSQVADRIGRFRVHFAASYFHNPLRQQIPKFCRALRSPSFLDSIRFVDSSSADRFYLGLHPRAFCCCRCGCYRAAANLKTNSHQNSHHGSGSAVPLHQTSSINRFNADLSPISRP